MDSQLYIPKKIKVGFQERSDCYTKKLAYVIYFDDKNVLRKEKSWESWRDKKIEPQEFSNDPIDGFLINKNISRYNWSHFSNNRTYIRLFDSRGFEFEISPENLIGILMNGDCSRRGLDGKFVYSWSGKDLVLLPANSEEYQKSIEFTKLQAGKIGARDLVPGCVYRTKKQEDLVYLGKMDWFERGSKEIDNPLTEEQHNAAYYNSSTYYYSRRAYSPKVDVPGRVGKKQFIFISLADEKTLTHVSGLTFLASKVSDVPIQNFAELMEKFETTTHSAGIKSACLVRATGDNWKPNFDKEYTAPYYGHVVERYDKKYYVDCGGGVFGQITISEKYNADVNAEKQWQWSIENKIKFNPENGIFDDLKYDSYGPEGRQTITFVNREQIEQNAMNFGLLRLELSNGKLAFANAHYYI